MATAPAKPTPETPPEAIEARFQRLLAAWNVDTMYLSDSQRIREHPAFQEIIRMGKVAVPLILRELEKQKDVLVWALPIITGADPLPPSERHSVGNMCAAWLHWGRENGYEW
jgi:hypothetical protein